MGETGRRQTPQLSVVMPVHNASPQLDEAVESIIRQTFSDFEFVIFDDASTDDSAEKLRKWASRDERIRLLESKSNLGPVMSSNRVARSASAPIVARMDADDVSLPDRLHEQIEVLRSRPDVGVVASLSDLIDSGGRKIRGPELWRLTRKAWSVPFAHGAIMYRQDIFDRVGGYREECELWEDQDLVTRMSEISKVAVIPRSLYQVRQSPTSTRSTADQDRQERALDRMFRSQRMAGKDEAEGNDKSSGVENRMDPRVFIALGSVILWGGGHPRLFRRLLHRANLSLDVRSLGAIVWTAWASISPRTLRPFLTLRLAIRNSIARRRLTSDDPVLWSPPRLACSEGSGLRDR